MRDPLPARFGTASALQCWLAARSPRAGRPLPQYPREVIAMTHNSKLESANVVAAFDNQWDADEAVLGLRLAGFRDDQFGYLARNIRGVVTDYVGRTYVLA